MSGDLFAQENLNVPEKKATKKKEPVQYKAYKPEDIKKATLDYFKGDSLAADVWINKYALRRGEEILELTPDQMHHRLAREFNRIEEKYKNPMSEDTIYSLLKDFRYIIPQGSPMFGIGNDFQIVSLSNCFVIGNEGESDSYGGIMKMDEEQVQLMKRRGGVGHDMSMIRPMNSPVKNSALTSTGIVPFMERYSNTTKEVAQGGRRGALMLSISIKHPDAENFIDAKMDTNKVTGANVSVRIDDEFMRCVKEDKLYTQQFPIDSKDPQTTIKINAKALWNKIIHNAWKSAEPGVLFWDTIQRESIPDCYKEFGFETISTNPCGEIPLCAYDSCRLLAVNLYSYVEKPFTPEASFNFALFKEHVMKAQRLMDDLIDLELEKVEQILAKIESDPESEDIKRVEKNLWLNIKLKCLEGRRTGLGVTAEGDMLAALGLIYGTDEATEFSTEVHKQLAIAAYHSSVVMASERGAFPIYDSKLEAKNPMVLRIKENAPEVYKDMVKYGRRNIALLTIAPTGSVSICTQTSSGIEPVFMVAYKRRRKVNPNDKQAKVSFTDEHGQAWEEYNVLHPKFIDWAEANGYNSNDIIYNYTDKQIEDLISKSPYNNATANHINWVNKVKMQGAIQKWVDHSISVTVNIPKETTEDIVSQIYMTAWECGCKGMTIYRDGSRNGVLVSNNSTENKAFADFKAPKRPKKLDAEIIRFQNANEKWIAVVGLYEGRPYEIFSGKAESFYLPNYVKNGWVIRVKEGNNPARYDFQYLDQDGYKVTMEGLSRLFNKEFWNYAKLISGVLRQGMPIANVISLISKLTLDSDTINTWKNGIERALKKYIQDGTKVEGEKCPNCGGDLIFTSGCKQCPDCGWSKCG
ncbi:MAG: adenosylcobalamin-dependent ribonucleoside-diphosphate reductase [Bacteroidales bacterium]|nr:adenosylcobalamin-dependent ribonucleoside-diphosphate reductase [Bacteroidales bacterium]MCF0211244.1 adenosylcobalamin-dependent ribonucleoside-diphosphate reductase [Bacteroidales bacterium]